MCEGLVGLRRISITTAVAHREIGYDLKNGKGMEKSFCLVLGRRSDGFGGGFFIVGEHQHVLAFPFLFVSSFLLLLRSTTNYYYI